MERLPPEQEVVGSSPAGDAISGRPASKRAYDRRRHASLRAIAEEILGQACIQCGSTVDVEFDHIDPSTKRFNLSDGHSYSMGEYLVEVLKCQPICKPHHIRKTLNQRGFELVKGQPVHGTVSSYRYCRCQECRAAKSDDNARRNRARGIPPKQGLAHGTYGCYRKGCRCDACRQANTAHHREYRMLANHRKAAQTR